MAVNTFGFGSCHSSDEIILNDRERGTEKGASESPMPRNRPMIPKAKSWRAGLNEEVWYN